LRETLGLRRRRFRLPHHVSIGRHSYGMVPGTFARPTAEAPISIGNFCSIGPEVLIFGAADHPTGLVSTYPFRARIWAPDEPNRDAVTRGPVSIGHDVWLGARAIILSGVSIGHGAIVGAGAVVARDLPPYAIAVGNPAEVVRHRFAPEIVAALLDIAWWDWPDARIRAAETLIYGEATAFIAAAQSGKI
jgi:acetyltransferase-like isoleucine patch superfamily enzyme